MRKLFSLCAAVLVALVANAATININTETADALRKALNTANDGDEIVMAAGTYVESNSNYIAFAGKHVTVKAAEGANVLIQPQVPIQITEGGTAHFVGVKIDASRLKELGSYEHLIVSADDNANNAIILNGCEFYGYNINSSMIYCSSSKVLKSIVISDCFFHDIKKSILFIESTVGTNVGIANSTFANITTDASSYFAGVIDSRATSGTFSINHCTFYNVMAMNTDYAAIGKVATPGATVSNSIFAMPTSTADLRAIRDVSAANNCLTFNYIKDSNTGIHSSVNKVDCFVDTDPKFQDAANGDYTLSYGSPALTAAQDGGAIGDPRWATKFYITGNFTGEGAKDWQAHDKAAVESYTFKNLAAGDYQMKITRNGTWVGENNIYGYDALTSKIGGLYRWNGGEPDNNIMFTLETAGDVTITYVHGEKFTVEGNFKIWPVELAGSWDSEWKDKRAFVPSTDKLTATLVMNFTNDNYEFKLIDNGTWKGKWINNDDDKYYITRSVLSVNNLEDGKNNLVITPDVAGDYKFTWTYGTGELTVEFPALPEPKYYLAGSMLTDGDWDKALAAMTENAGVWSKTVNFASTDTKEFKIVRSVEGIHIISQDWLGLAAAQTITATTADLVIGTGDTNIGITPNITGDYVFTFNPEGNKVSVTYPKATAIDNTEAVENVVKTFENGQLIIIKNGVKYNAQGTIVR